MKQKQAMRAVNECACTWVNAGESIRDLTLAESIAMRAMQEKQHEPLDSPELPGLMFEPPRTATNSAVRRTLVQAANHQETWNQFVMADVR